MSVDEGEMPLFESGPVLTLTYKVDRRKYLLDKSKELQQENLALSERLIAINQKLKKATHDLELVREQTLHKRETFASQLKMWELFLNTFLS
jgi:hypothetical protein